MDESVFRPLEWRDNSLWLLDQRGLPAEEAWIAYHTPSEVAVAIREMVVRGAPAIGCAAAYGVALAATEEPVDRGRAQVRAACAELAQARPTAVNLAWALDEMQRCADAATVASTAELAKRLLERALEIHTEDIELCRRIGRYGGALMPDEGTVLTHCNAGALATGGYGTALGVIRGGREAGKSLRVVADETRPYLQGVRLTAWELTRDGFDVTVIPDGAAALLMRRGEISCCVVGADRIARNGDVANKIGTYGVALAAHAHGIPFYVAAPYSTVDLACDNGDAIPIEERSADEMYTRRELPQDVHAYYPAFDITPAALITALILDRGVVRAPLADNLAALLGDPPK